MTDPTLAAACERIERLFETRLKLRKGDFEKRVARARKMLPRSLRRDFARLLDARRMSEIPKTARMIDMVSVRRSAARIEAHLAAVDLADRRKGRMLALLASVMASLIVVFALVLFVLRWRGYV